MSDLNTKFSNCFNFINDMKKVIESDHDRYDNIYMEESIFHAEIDLMEMELEASYDAEMYDSIINGNAFRTSKRASRRKQNKKNKERDRIHGRQHGGMHGGVDFRYVDCNPYANKHRYEDTMFCINGKHRHNADRKASAMSARELDYASGFSEKGELMDKADFLDEAIRFGEREIENLEYEKAFGYLSDRGDAVIEECKRNLSELKDYKKDILRIINTATR